MPLTTLVRATRGARTGAIALALALLSGCEKASPDRPATVGASVDSVPRPASAEPVGAAVNPWTVSARGAGPVHVGMTVAQAALALGAAPPRPGVALSCGYARLAGVPAGLRYFALNDTILRVDVDSAGIPTAEGAAVGDSDASVRSRYGARASSEPLKYVQPPAHAVVVDEPGPRQGRLRFESDGARVVHYRAGRRDAVDLVEGCG
jgi:hypothetical protein